MRRLVVLCPHPEGVAPSQRFKFEQYFDDWRSAGWEVIVRPFWDLAAWRAIYARGAVLRKSFHLLRGFLRRLGDLGLALKADLVYLHLEAAPLGPPVLERLLVRRGIPLVYDIDDLIQLPHGSRANPFMAWLRSRSKPLQLMEMADHVVVCTEYLREIASQRNPRVTNISSTIDTDRYRPVEPRNRTRGVVVGWSGSHSTSPYLHLLDEVLLELQRTEGIRVRVIGDGGFSVPGLELEASDWRGETEVADLAEIDIGVYPLPDAEWVLGKSGLKLLQYMAMGLPAVAEKVGTNLKIVDEGVNGLLAQGPEEWLRALRALIRDPTLRARMGRAGRETVESRYSVRANAHLYREVLSRAGSDLD